MSITTDLYLLRSSWVHRLEPRVKLLFVACCLWLSILNKNLWVMLMALLLVHLIHWQAQIPRERLVFVWRTLLPIGLLMMLLRILFYPEGSSLFQFWVIDVTVIAIVNGATLALRLVTMAFTVFAWLYTTTQTDLIQSLVKLKMPYSWGLTLALALRYIPTFQSTYTMISEAQQARGLSLGETKGYKRVQKMLPIFVTMIITALRTSSHLAMAIEARGFGVQGQQRTALYDLQARPVDYGVTAVLILITLLFTILYFATGFGAHPIALL